MARSAIRVLVAEDFDVFRRFLVSVLHDGPDLQVISEVSDGLEAVEKAQELRPDLVLMDIGLPGMNGIEAARRIRDLSPETKILFVSQESSLDIVHEALATGAFGYVVKTDAGSELLIAIHSVLQGQHFVGRRFARRDFRLVASIDEGRIFAGRRHEAAFYSGDASFIDGFVRFIEGALKTGNAALVVATSPHRDALLPKLQATGLDIEAAIADGRYVPLDATETLSSFMVNDMPNSARFLENVTDLILGAAKAAKGEHSRVVACGECAPLLWSQGNAEAAIRVEQLWDKVSKVHSVEILCGYAKDSFYGERGRSIYQRICAEHSAVHSS